MNPCKDIILAGEFSGSLPPSLLPMFTGTLYAFRPGIPDALFSRVILLINRPNFAPTNFSSPNALLSGTVKSPIIKEFIVTPPELPIAISVVVLLLSYKSGYILVGYITLSGVIFFTNCPIIFLRYHLLFLMLQVTLLLYVLQSPQRH